MAEDYSSTKFNSYNTIQSQSNTDPCSLYVKSVPAYLTQDSFQSKFSEYGRIVRFRLYPPRANSEVTIGLVNYETPLEAQEALHHLNRRPPLNLEISYANCKSSNVTLKDINLNLTKNDQPTPLNVSKTLGRGRGQFMQSENFPPLKIKIDGNKRVATSYSPDEYKENTTLSKPKIPELILNPNFLCLACKKPGEFSCAACKRPYCSSQCQAEDWNNHNSICDPFSEKKDSRSSQNQCKYDTGYMSECSNNSDTEKKAVNNLPSKVLNSVKSLEVLRQGPGAFPKRSSQSFGSSKKLTFIKSNEIEDSSLPLNRDEKVYVCNFQSPSKLWLHLKTARSVLSEMEKKLNDVVDKSAVTCTVNDVCCTVQDGVLRRIKVIEIKPNAIIAEFIDYGGTSFVKNNLIYHLPLTFKEYSSQAICCKLVDDDGKVNTQWNDEDFTSFHQYTKDKEFKVKTYQCYNNIYDVSLVNQEGVSLYFIAQSLLEPLVENVKPSVNLLNQIPCVWSHLKEGMNVKIKSQELDEEKFWGLLDDGSGCDKCLTELDNFLENVETEVINMSCKEGDVAIGFSTGYKQYFRCVILKRLQSSFLVRYIDFGNTEEITELRSANQALLQIRSYMVCCTKPHTMSSDKFQNAFKENLVDLSVKSVKKSVIELSFTYGSHSFILPCFPWDHGVPVLHSQLSISKIQEKGTSFKSNTLDSRPLKDEVKSNDNKFCKSFKPISPVAQSLVKKTEGNIPQTFIKVMKDSISEKKLTVGSKYNVNMSVFKNSSEMYVHFAEDEQRLASFCLQMNQHCITDTCSKYSPVKDEVVCCLFSVDNKWYRAQVLEKVGENKFKVLFIDFGNEDIVSDINLKPLPQKFVSMKLSACVSLYNVRNEDISNLIPKLLEESWVMEVKDASKCAKVMFFQGQTSLLELINVKNTFLKSSLKFQKLPSDTVSEVEICHVDDKKLYFQQAKDLKGIEVLQEKINFGDSKELPYRPEINNVYCCRFEKIWYRAYVQNQVSPNTFRVSFIDYGNVEDVLSKDFKEISRELFALSVYCIPVIAETVNKDLLKPKTLYSVQVIEEKAGIQKVKFLNLSEDSQQNVFLSSFEQLTLKNGFNEVIFFHSENGVYYCQLKENIEKYTEMADKLQTAKLNPLVKPPQIGEVVCAKSSDKCWYRASIVGIHKSNFKVCFIDFGNSELVATEDMKFLPNDFHKYPIFSIPVRIKNITEANIDFGSIFLLSANGFASDGSQFAEIVLSENMGSPNISSLKNTLLPVDKELDIILCHFENNVYYAHTASSKRQIESLEIELKNAATFENLLDLPNKGDVICAKFTDGIWYRGSVKNVYNDQKSCQICFIDYGNIETIEFKDLKMLPTKLSEIPILAVPMKFVNDVELKEQLLANVSTFKIKVVDKSSDNITIVELVVPENDIVSSIESRVLPESLTKVVVVYKEGEILYVHTESDLSCLTDIMINLQKDASRKTIASPKVGQLVCVKFHDELLYRGLIKEKSGNNVKVFFVDYGNTDIVTEIFNLPSKYSSIPMFSIPVIISNEEVLASPLEVDSDCRVKYTGKMTGNVQVVRVCPPVDHILLPSIKTSSLERGSSDVYFHCFDGQFYFVSKATDITKLNEMKSMLANFTGNEIYHVPSVREVLLAKCEKMWYRVNVKKINETKKECEAFLIDLGSIKTIPFSNMSYIPKSISSFPIFLNKVSLSASDPLKTTILFGKCYTITVLENSTDVPIIKVLRPVMFTSIERKSLPLNEVRNVMFFHKENDTMFLQDCNDALHVTEMQVEAEKCALSRVISHNPIRGEMLCAQSGSDEGWYRCCIEEVVDTDRYKVYYIDYGNSEVVSKENLRCLSSSLSMYPSFGIAVKIVNQLPVELSKLYSVIAVSEPVDNIQLVKLLLEEDICNEPVVEITSKDEPNLRFFFSSSNRVQFVSGEQDVAIYSVVENFEMCTLFCTPFIQKDIEANRELTEKITEYCNSLNCSSYNGDFLPESGEMVLAKSDDDQKWYRAVVFEYNDPSFDVVFPDTGIMQTVHKDFLRKMEKKFMSLAMQTETCNLKGFKAFGNDMTNIIEEVNNFTIHVYPEPLKAILTVKDTEDCNDIDIEIPVITNYLVEKGIATIDRS